MPIFILPSISRYCPLSICIMEIADFDYRRKIIYTILQFRIRDCKRSIRHTDKIGADIHLSGIFADRTALRSWSILEGNSSYQQSQLNFGIPLLWLHIQHGKSSKQCYILWILSLATGIPAGRIIIDKVFPDHISHGLPVQTCWITR